MQKKIPLEDLIPHGDVSAQVEDGVLKFTPKIRAANYFDARAPSLILSEKVKLPFRMDVSLNLDVVGFRVIVGSGLIPFTAGWNGRAIENLVDGGPKSWKVKMFDAAFELNKDVAISITYDYEFMMIEIDGEMRYLSKKERYMKSPLLEEANEAGVEVKFMAERHSTVMINALFISEYSNDEITRLRHEMSEREEITLNIPGTVDKGKESFEECIAWLPVATQQEITQTNDHLMSMKKELKIKRSIEGTHKGCRIKYNSSEFGFGYHIIISNGWASHFFWFSMHFNRKYGDFGARKCDYTEAMLDKIAEKSPEVAKKIFDYYGECGICVYADRGGSKCPTVYEHDGVKRTTCHGQMQMSMKPETFGDVRVVFDALYEILVVK